MPEARFLKITVVVLLLLNLGMLAYLWTGRQHPRHPFPPPPQGLPGPGGRGGAAAFLYDALELTDAQEAAYKKMREQHHRTVMGVRNEMKESKRSLYALMKSGDSTATRPEEQRWLDSLAAQQRRIETITYAHFREVRSLCTPQQQQKFDEVIGEALEQMR